jgi:hypothetical protein
VAAEGRHSVPALDQLGVDGNDHTVAAEAPTPHAGMYILGGIAVPLDRNLRSLELVVEVDDECADVATDVEHDGTTPPRPMVVMIMVMMIVVMIMRMGVITHGAPTERGCTS